MTTPSSSLFARFKRLALLDGPTPIQRLHRLEQTLGEAAGGVRLFVKRDDLPFLGGGGNKLRRLEFLLGEALAQGADTFITTGGIQSNHARLSAAASARAGLACELVLGRMVPREDEEYRRNGNMLLDGLFGAKVHKLPGSADALAFAHDRATELQTAGRRPYVVGAGGSSPVGCLGYADCARDRRARASDRRILARIVIANGSSGTHAGLAAGLAAMGLDPAKVRSFTVLEALEAARQQSLALARATLALLDGEATIEIAGIDVVGDQRGQGYGIPTAAMLEAVRLFARTEGLLLDPVYSGKAFAGLLADVRQEASPRGAAVLFIMTGGTPGLFAYRSAFDEA